MDDHDDPLEIHDVGDGCWRICDRRLPEHDPTRLLAYAEVSGNDVEVVWFGSHGRRSRYDRLDDVLAACRTLLYSREAERRRPVSIPHFAPPTGAVSLPRGAASTRR